MPDVKKPFEKAAQEKDTGADPRGLGHVIVPVATAIAFGALGLAAFLSARAHRKPPLE